MLKNNEKILLNLVKVYNEKLHEQTNNGLKEVESLKKVTKKIEKICINVIKFENGKVYYKDNCYNEFVKNTDKLIEELEYALANFDEVFNETILEMLGE